MKHSHTLSLVLNGQNRSAIVNRLMSRNNSIQRVGCLWCAVSFYSLAPRVCCIYPSLPSLGSCNQEHGRQAFFIPVPYKTLSDKDKRTVNFVISKIHGLSYLPSQTEHARNRRCVGTLIKNLYQDYSTTFVGTKEVTWRKMS